MKFWKRKKKEIETERRIKANNPEYNASFQYAENYISTAKYNLLTFLPKNLLEQFQRIANAYFLCLLILQVIPMVSSLTPYTTILPLVAVLGLTAIKDAIDDILIPQISSLTYITTILPLAVVFALTALKEAVDDVQRHRSDNRVNNRMSYVLRDGKITEELWHKVVVGDIIKMENNQFVAADLLLLSSSEPNSLCYIETAELDGETNLKVKQALPDTAELGQDEEALSNFNAEFTCEAPNNNLPKFDGCMKWNGTTYPLDNDKILLRGCVLRNTQWCYGLVIFAGRDTKLMMNSGEAKFKRTNIDRFMNYLIKGIVLFLLCTCLICTIATGIWETTIGYHFQTYLPWEDFIPASLLRNDPDETIAAGATCISLLVFFSYIIILNTVVPISLYVSVEIIRFSQSWWINWDSKMHYKKNDTPARARTTTLNEELGQIEYIFSDKTGTLTQNIMTFNKCSINGKMYGDPQDSDGNPMQISENTKVDFSEVPLSETTFEFYDKRLLQLCRDGDSDATRFFKLLALCHTVMAEKNKETGNLEYQAQSPDENALVSAARNFGFAFKTRTPTTVTILNNGKDEVYELLCILDFNNVRKRMSVIVRKDNKITLLCKGADSTVCARLHPKCQDLLQITQHHLNEFAQTGLRTLCLAEKVISEEEYSAWKKKHHEASTTLVDRDEKLDAVYEEIETNMELLGATAIEDKLQDGVPDCIANLALAGIKIWVLTGDRQETAINIGFSCRLLTEEMEEVFVVDGETYEEVEEQLTKAGSQMKGTLHHNVDVVSFSGTMTPTPMINHMLAEEHGGYALVINGHSLVHALKPDMEKLLLDTGCMCKAVICCRVTPLQKALVVDLVKHNKKSITLAVGDGANDVSMIKTAHIGVGISGQEGMQAVLASDFSLAQFRYLERLLLVHGRWSYLRMCKFLKYFFYKNFAFTLCHLWYGFFCGFSAQSLYDPIFISAYNLAYTSLPILALGIFEQDVSDESSLRYPKLYAPGHLNLLFNKKEFLKSVIEGIVSSFILFFIPYGAFNGAVDSTGHDMSGHSTFGTTVAAILVVVVTLRCAIDTHYWTWFNHLTIWGSLIFYFVSIFLLYCEPVYSLVIVPYIGSAEHTLATASFWFSMVLVNVILLTPIIAYRFYYIDTQPNLSDRVQLRVKQHALKKTKSKSREFFPSRASLRRSSRRSIRSGYAFAHEEGFGELITSGSIMRRSTSGGLLPTQVHPSVQNGAAGT